MEVVERRDKNGRYASVFDDLTLVAIVKRVCLYVVEQVAPDKQPAKVTQREFDASRVPAGYPTVKRAYEIAQQLSVAWPRLLEAIFTSDESVTRLLVAAGRRLPSPPTREEAVAAIKLIAKRLGAKTLIPSEYESELLVILKADELHWRHQASAPRALPTRDQIEHAFVWNELLLEAELELSGLAGRAGMPQADALELFLCELGYLPTSIDVLRAYANEKGFALQDRATGGARNIGVPIAELRDRWSKLGRWVPDTPAAKDQRPPWKVEPLPDHGVARAKRRRWDYDGCLESLVTAIGENDGRQISLDRYQTMSTGRPDLAPKASVLRYAKQEGTTFTAMRDEAMRVWLRKINGGADYADRMDELPPELDEEALAKKFAPQFEAARNLQAEAWRNRPSGSAAEGKQYKALIFAVFARATLTYRAILHLCRGGYTDQADMLTRSLFEDMAVAHWVSLPDHQDEVADLIQKHHDFSRLLAADSLAKHVDWLGETFDAEDIEQLEAKRDEYKQLFGNYGEKSWVGKGLHAVITEIEHLWEDETRRKRELWGYYALGHRVNNQKLHNSALSLNQAAQKSGVDKEGNLVIRLGASPTDDEDAMIRALYGAMFTYGRITRLVIKETGGDVDAFDTFYAKQLDLAYKLAPKRRHKIGRNDPCPCESGKKYKNCHGA